MNTRNLSIRSKIVALGAVPLAALLALWIFATVLTAGPAMNLLSARTFLDKVSRPGENLVAELQRERRLSVVFLSSDIDGTALGQQRARTDAVAAVFRREATSSAVRTAATDLLLDRIDEMITSLEALAAGRGFIDRRAVDPPGALNLYSGVVDTAFRMFGALATLEDEQINREARAVTALGRAREVLGQADSLLAGALTAGRFRAGEHVYFVQIVGTQRYLYADAVADLSEPDRARYQRMTEGSAFTDLRSMQEQLIVGGAVTPLPVDATRWQGAYDSVARQLREYEDSIAEELADRTTPVATSILARLAVAGLLGLSALLVSIVVAVRVGRSLIRRLGGLRGDALQLAKQRLPEVVLRLRRGEQVDVAAEAPALEYGTDEIGQLGHAFTEVQRTAVQSAVDEAALRRGLNEVFLNIARRSQTLLHRQLALLDGMERRATEPEELEDLFRVDHLATRMRRHAEDLVILAGATPGRGWRNPVPFVDVIRGAVSEVEDYRRIDVAAVAGASLAGRAVGDVIHLLAELLENATSFSPPHTRVQVAGQVVPNGFAIEVEDRGLGMTSEAIDDANRRLAESRDFDPANSARLGLFVVGQLSARHGVQVRLRPSPYGGVTAVALIPASLVAPVPDPAESAVDPAGRAGAAGRPTPVELRPVRSGLARAAHDGPARHATHPAADEPAVPDGLDRRRRTGSRLGASAASGARRRAAGVEQAPGIGIRPAPAGPGPLRPAVDDPAAQGLNTLGPAALGPAAQGLNALGSAAQASAAQDSVVHGAAAPVRPAAGGVPGAGTPAEPLAVGADGLPQRVRQTHLSARLREPAAPAPAAPARSPERVRSLMSSLQAGTARGREAAATPAGPPASSSAGEAGAGSPGPVPGGTPAPAVLAHRTATGDPLPVPAQRPGPAESLPELSELSQRPQRPQRPELPELPQRPAVGASTPSALLPHTVELPEATGRGATMPTGPSTGGTDPRPAVPTSTWFTDSAAASPGGAWSDAATAGYPVAGRKPPPYVAPPVPPNGPIPAGPPMGPIPAGPSVRPVPAGPSVGSVPADPPVGPIPAGPAARPALPAPRTGAHDAAPPDRDPGPSRDTVPGPAGPTIPGSVPARPGVPGPVPAEPVPAGPVPAGPGVPGPVLPGLVVAGSGTSAAPAAAPLPPAAPLPATPAAAGPVALPPLPAALLPAAQPAAAQPAAAPPVAAPPADQAPVGQAPSDQAPAGAPATVVHHGEVMPPVRDTGAVRPGRPTGTPLAYPPATGDRVHRAGAGERVDPEGDE